MVKNVNKYAQMLTNALTNANKYKCLQMNEFQQKCQQTHLSLTMTKSDDDFFFANVSKSKQMSTFNYSRHLHQKLASNLIVRSLALTKITGT